MIHAAGLDAAVVSMARGKMKLEEQALLEQRGPWRCWPPCLHSHSTDVGNVQLGPPLKKSLSPNRKDFSCKINPKNNCRAPCGFYILSQGSSTCFWGLVEKYPSPAAVWKGTGFGRGVLGAKHSCQLCSKGLQQQSGSWVKSDHKARKTMADSPGKVLQGRRLGKGTPELWWSRASSPLDGAPGEAWGPYPKRRQTHPIISKHHLLTYTSALENRTSLWW